MLRWLVCLISVKGALWSEKSPWHQERRKRCGDMFADFGYYQNREVTRWRENAGFKIDYSQFYYFGDVWVRKSGFYDEAIADEMKIFYDQGTQYVKGMSSILAVLDDVINQMGGLVRPHYIRRAMGWDEILKTSMKSHQFPKSDHYYSDRFGFSAWKQRLEHVIGKPSEQKSKGEPMNSIIANVTEIFTDVQNTLALFKALESTKQPRISYAQKATSMGPHPRYLYWVDTETRAISAREIADLSSRVKGWIIDGTVPEVRKTRLQNAAARLTKEAFAASERYTNLLSKYGHQYTPGTRPWEKKLLRPSENDKIKAEATSKSLRDIANAFSKAGKVRPDGVPGQLKMDFGVVPHVVVTLQVTHEKVKSVTVSELKGSRSERVGPATRAKMEGVPKFLKKVFETFLARMIYSSVRNQSMLPLLASSRGAELTVFLKTQLLCYWQNDVHRPRMIEQLYVHIPGITSSDMKDPQGWLFVGLLFDSEKHGDGENLLLMYLADEAEQGGKTLVPQPPGPGCIASRMFEEVAKRMSVDSHFPHVARRLPKTFKKTQFTTCLNWYPLDSEFVFDGVLRPLAVPAKPNLVETQSLAARKEKFKPQMWLEMGSKLAEVEDVSVVATPAPEESTTEEEAPTTVAVSTIAVSPSPADPSSVDRTPSDSDYSDTAQLPKIQPLAPSPPKPAPPVTLYTRCHPKFPAQDPDRYLFSSLRMVPHSIFESAQKVS